jgi:hypothetical protein
VPVRGYFSGGSGVRLSDLAKLAADLPRDIDTHADGGMARATEAAIKEGEGDSLAAKVDLLQRILIQQSKEYARLSKAYCKLRDIILQAEVS